MPTLRIVLLATLLVLGVTAAAFGYFLVGPGRYAEFEEIQERLQEIPGVKVVEAFGHEDVTFEIGGFELEVEGKGPLSLGCLDLDSFESTDHLYLQSLGDHELIVVMHGHIGVYRSDTGESIESTGWGGSIDIGPRGAFARFFPFSVDSVQGIVHRYDEIESALAEWPVQPDYGTLEDEDGIRYFYALRDPASEEQWISPSELEDQ